MTLQQSRSPQAALLSEQVVSLCIIPLLSELGKMIFKNGPCLWHGFRLFFFKVLHLSLERSNCQWADSLPPQCRETSSAEFTTAANSLGGSTKNTLHLEILDDSFPRADENYCYFFEGNFQEVLKISIIRGVGFKCNIHCSFELLVNPVCFLQYPHISLWK